ncbi:hypothetical protein JOD31_002148 [Methylopila capsulata]|uniref:Uncharacterized protein n=1 Tax=Methylopila capsulata TaxID=61654 RepID=A0A9W6MR79_9HYPH|nr:hypothetical protein [Methylopila capsulata]MBM7851923.1 hypothetical protein [Methylopila capsulata]GLK54988.1 hypothetical protein GCM10008170_10070 [Methylopila capsulata]
MAENVREDAMPYNVLVTQDGRSTIAFARSATEALALAREKEAAGLSEIVVMSNDGGQVAVDRLIRLAELEAITPTPPSVFG